MAILSLKFFLKELEMSITMYTFVLLSIKYQKMFNEVEHNKCKEILKIIGIYYQYLSILSNLYWNTILAYRIEEKLLKSIPIQKVFRQDYVL